MVWWITRNIGFWNCIMSRLIAVSKLESQHQDWCMCKFSTLPNHFAVDQRSRGSEINRRSLWHHDQLQDGRFPNYEMLDTKITSALKKIISTMHFRGRVSAEEQRAQKCDRFLRWRQNTNMIWEYFRAPKSYEAVQGLVDLFSIRLRDDDVQDFDTRWDQALLAASEILSETILEGLCKSKLQDSVQLHTVLAMYEQENVRNNEPPNYLKMETLVRRHIDQVMRTRNFRARNDRVESGTVTKRGKTKRKVSVERMLSVESNRTVFWRRFMQFQSWWSIWKQIRSESKRTIVFSCT